MRGLHAGIAIALFSAAVGLMLSLAALARFPLSKVEELDLTPSPHWPEPGLAVEPHPEEGPVLVMVEYRINPKHAADFTFAMQARAAAASARRSLPFGTVS